MCVRTALRNETGHESLSPVINTGTKMSNVIYLNTARLKAVANTVADLKPGLFSDGKITADQVMIALGEFGDIWPESIQPEPTPSILSVVGQGPVPCNAMANHGTDRDTAYGDTFP
jgi:hypothetical protein